MEEERRPSSLPLGKEEPFHHDPQDWEGAHRKVPRLGFPYLGVVFEGQGVWKRA